jgi:hypothetical protein
LWPPSADFVHVGSPLYLNPLGFFTRFWPLFANSAYADMLLYAYCSGFYMRL